MRRVLICLAVLLFCVPADATVYYRVHEPLATTTGEAITGASYWFYTPGTTDTVAVYSDATGTRSYHGNGFQTGADGMIDKYVEAGTYDIEWSHSGWNLSGTLTNYSYGVASEVSMEGTVEAYAFDAEDWILAGGPFTGQTLETSGLLKIGTTLETGGTATIEGDIYVTGRSQFGYDAVDNDYSLTITPNWIIVRPLLVVNDDIQVYGNVHLFGKDAASGKLTAQNVECDTLKAADLYVRAIVGGNDATIHSQFFHFEPVDISLGLPDTSDHEVGTLFYAATDDSFRYLAGAGMSKRWRALGHSSGTPGADNPELSVSPTTLNFTYADSAKKEFVIDNIGEGVLNWTTANICTWIASGDPTPPPYHYGVNDSAFIGVALDTVDVQLMWAQIAQGASLHDTVAVTSDYGNSQVIIHADGQPFTGQDYVVEPNHPRLFFNEDELATLRAKCYSAERVRYDKFMTYVDSYLIDYAWPRAYVYEQGMRLGWLAFASVASQDTTYLHEAVLCAQSLFDDFPTLWYSDNSTVTGYAKFYDWCYNDMGATRRSHFGDSLGVMVGRKHAASNYMNSAMHSQIVTMGPIMQPALAAYGDGLNDTDAAAALDSIYAHTFGNYHMLAILDSIGGDGGSYEGMSYGTPNGESKLLWLWDHGTDKDPWAASSNIEGWGDYMLYNVGARTEVAPDGDAFGSSKMADDTGHLSGRADQMLQANMFATAYDDSLQIWLSDQYDAYTAGTANSFDCWLHIVYQDTVMTAVAPTERTVDYPSAKRFDLAAVFMRDGWDLSPASTDVWATYRHTQFRWGHGDASAGSFILGRGHDLLLIESGEYDGCTQAHRRNYAVQTVASNAITVKRSGADFGGYENSGGQYRNDWDCPTPEFTVGSYTDSLAGSGNVGNITDYAHRADTLTYMRSDLSPAYSAATVDTVRREFVWMEPDGVFLVFDYADVDSTGYLQKSLFHTINNPTFNSGDKTWTVVHGDSEATLTFYGNDDNNVEVGGAGAEFEVNGTNYPPSGSHSDNGAYRIEAIMPRDTEQRWLLTIIETSAVGGADYGTVATVEVGDYIGAIVNSDTLLFHKYGGDYDYRPQ